MSELPVAQTAKKTTRTRPNQKKRPSPPPPRPNSKKTRRRLLNPPKQKRKMHPPTRQNSKTKDTRPNNAVWAGGFFAENQFCYGEIGEGAGTFFFFPLFGRGGGVGGVFARAPRPRPNSKKTGPRPTSKKNTHETTKQQKRPDNKTKHALLP